MIEFTLDFAPVPWGRAVPIPFALRGGQLRVKMVTPEETRVAEQAVRMLSAKYKPRKPLSGALGVTTVHVIAPPQKFDADRSRDWPHVKPDDDNYRKLVLDALNGMFWHDDGQICGGSSWKVYGDRPRTYIRIWQLGRSDLALVRHMIGDPEPQVGMFDGEDSHG